MKKLIFLIILILAIGGGAYYYVHKQNQNEQPTSIINVKKGAITEKAEAIGYIKPRHLITVKSQVGGIVADIYHWDGDQVSAKEPLLAVDPTPAPDEYATAVEAVREAKTNETNALNDFKRYQKAYKVGLITRNYTNYISSLKTLQASHAQYVLAKQKLALLEHGKTDVNGKTIANIVTSPIDGFIIYRSIDVGDPVISLSSAQSATSLFTIANMKDLMFEGSVDEMDAAKIKVNMPATITIGALPHHKIPGTLTRISLQSDQQANASTDTNSPFNVSFKIEVTHLQFQKKITLRAGYSATANINIKTAKDVPILPVRVIQFEDSKAYVIVPTSHPKQPKKQFIKLGLSDGINTQIISGLKIGDPVIDNATPEAQTKDKNIRSHPRKKA